MNLTLILTISAGAISAAAALFSYKDKKTIAICFTLTAAAINCISAFFPKKDYSTEVPAVTASYLGKFIRIIVVNVDKELPLKDVSAKMQGSSAIDLGTLYPRVVNNIADLEVPKQNTTWVMTVWYNSTKSIEVDFNITVNPDSTVKIESKYFDNKQIEFTPDWKNKASGIDTTSHYNPTLFK